MSKKHHCLKICTQYVVAKRTASNITCLACRLRHCYTMSSVIFAWYLQVPDNTESFYNCKLLNTLGLIAILYRYWYQYHEYQYQSITKCISLIFHFCSISGVISHRTAEVTCWCNNNVDCAGGKFSVAGKHTGLDLKVVNCFLSLYIFGIAFCGLTDVC